MIDRRAFVAASGSLIAATVATSLRHAAFAAASAAAPSGDAGARLNALFDAFMDERLMKDPEALTSLGLDKGKYAWAKSKLGDASVQRSAELKREVAARLKRLKAFDRASLRGRDLANYDTVAYSMETIARTEPFQYGDLTHPYVISQLTGSYQEVPTFLDKEHQIADARDADAYLARLAAFATVLDQETERVRHDAGLKVVPPDFLIDHTLAQMKKLRSAAAADSILSTSVGARTQKLGIPGDYGARAARIVEKEVYPALDRQGKALGDLRPDAVHDAGIGRLPQGAALYELALRQATTTEMTPEEVHQLGLDQAKEISARMEALLRSQGMTRGTVIERLEALNKDPEYLYPNTDAGRQQVLEYCNGLLAALQPYLPKYFHILPKAPVEIRRVPAYTEAGPPAATTSRPRSMGHDRAPSTSTCAIPANDRAGRCQRSCTMRLSPGIISSLHW